MKKGKIFTGLACFAMAAVICAAMAGCSKNDPEEKDARISELTQDVERITQKYLTPTITAEITGGKTDEDGDLEFQQMELSYLELAPAWVDEQTPYGYGSGGLIRNPNVDFGTGEKELITGEKLLEEGAVKVTVNFAYEGDDTFIGRFVVDIFALNSHFIPMYAYNKASNAKIAVLYNDGKNWFNITSNPLGSFSGDAAVLGEENNYGHNDFITEADLEGYAAGLTPAKVGSAIKITKTSAGKYASMDFYICWLSGATQWDQYSIEHINDGVENTYQQIFNLENNAVYGYNLVFSFEGPQLHDTHAHYAGTNTYTSTTLPIMFIEDHKHEDE
jgi:hypothetical protein